VIPIYVGETHAGGLGGKLFAQVCGLATWQQREGFEDYAMFGILPAMRAELREDRCTVGRIVSSGGIERGWFGTECAEDSGFEVNQFGQVGHGLKRELRGSAERSSLILGGKLGCAGNNGPHEINAVNGYGDAIHWCGFARYLRTAKRSGAGTHQDGRATLSLRR
jgi:hypothetical protein